MSAAEPRPEVIYSTWTPEGVVTFTWTAGGPYIHVTYPGAVNATNVLNVWDYGTDRCNVESWRDFTEVCQLHIAELLDNDGHDLIMHIEAAQGF